MSVRLLSKRRSRVRLGAKGEFAIACILAAAAAQRKTPSR